MSGNEFDKIWRLLQTLWPNAAAKKSKNDIEVFRRGLAGYSMPEVADRIMEYARGNKYFPDLADITAGLKAAADETDEIEAAIIHNAKLLARIKRIKAPDFANKAEAMEWFHGLEGKHEESVST